MKKHFVVIGLLLLLASVVVLALTPADTGYRDEVIENAKLKRIGEIQAEREAGYGTRTTPTQTTTNTVYQPYDVPVEKTVPVYDPTVREDIAVTKDTITALIKRVEFLEKKIETLPLQGQFNTLVNSLAPQIKNLRKENQILSRQILWLKKIIKDAGLDMKGEPKGIQDVNEPNDLDPNTQDSNSVRQF